MKLTGKLAYTQLITNRRRTVWTLAGIVLATAMVTAVFGFAASGVAMIRELIGDNDHYATMLNATLYTISAVFVLIIVSASVIVVSNSFRVSAGERIALFGILKSVGATKKQIVQIIMSEGVYLCAVGIPVGIALGLLVNIAGIEIVNYFLKGINRLMATPLVIKFVFAWQALLFSIIVSFLTVLLSAWLPARKAAGISAIDAIRGAGEAKVKPTRVRVNRLIGKLFGFEGALASKSLGRSKRSFRATVVSLTVSVTLLITAGSFGAQLQTMVDELYPGVDATVGAEFFASVVTSYVNADASSDVGTVKREYDTISSDNASSVATRLREYSNTPVFGVGSDSGSYWADVPRDMVAPSMLESFDSHWNYPDSDEMHMPIVFVVTDSENYVRLCRLAGVPLGSNILVNRYAVYTDGGRSVFAPYEFSSRTLRVTDVYDGSEFDLPLHGELKGLDIPGEVIYAGSGSLVVIVPAFDVMGYFWFAKPDDKAGFIEYAEDVLNEMIPQEDNGVAYLSVIDIEEITEAMQSTGRLVMVLIFGFVGMLTLIGLTNVISTISANVRSRSREFAVLRSVGMTTGGLRRMLNLESVLCSVKSLVFGVPLGIIGSYLVYAGITGPAEYAYTIPWLPIIGCAFGVFVITWVTMRYSAAQLRGGSIVDAIR